MKKLLLISAAVFTLKVAQGQTTFQKTYGGTGTDNANSVNQTSDGGFIIIGHTASFSTNTAVYLVKTDSDGSLQWTKTFNGTNSNAHGYAVQQTSDGGFIIAGDVSLGSQGLDVCAIKTASDGTLIWSTNFGGTKSDEAYSVKQINDGGYIIAGRTKSFGAGDYDMYLARTSSDGSLQWTKTFGGTGVDEASRVLQTNDGGFIICGQTTSFTGNYEGYLVKTDSDGNLQWSETFGGTSSTGNDIRQTNDGGFIVLGTIMGWAQDIYLVKTTSDGMFQWGKTFGGAGSNSDDQGISVRQSNDGGYIIGGYRKEFSSGDYDLFLLKTTSAGILQWMNNYGGTSYEFGYGDLVDQTSNGGYILTGYTFSYGSGSYDFYLVKTDSNGNSGCNQKNITPVLPSPTTPTAVTTATPQVSSGGTAGVLATTIASGGAITNLCTTVGINENILTDNFLIYPNPFSTQTAFQTDIPLTNATLTVYNCFGQTVAQIKNINGHTITFNRNDLPSGLYFISLTEENKTISVDKLVIIDR